MKRKTRSTSENGGESAKPFKKGDRVQVTVDRLAVGGRGVARHQGLVIFVADTIVGEKIEVEITRVKKSFAEGALTRVLTASPHRRQPPCPVALECGGCNWQHIGYPEQLRWKRELVDEAFRKFSGFAIAPGLIRDVIPSPDEFRYRNRIQLHHDGTKMGFFRRGSHRIVDIDDCPITEEAISSRIPSLKRELSGQKAGRLEIFISQSGEVGRRRPTQSQIDESKGDSPEGAEAVGPSFSQVNTLQNENLIRHVVSLAEESRPQTIYDLYAGGGNFTFPLHEKFPRAAITAVELNPASVEAARDTVSRRFAGSSLRFIEASVDRFLDQERLPPDATVVLDPPRAGCGIEVMESLARQLASRIIYVSCHPVTLARDLKTLAGAGYQLVSVQPFDMFPQTDHVETVAVLTR
jgi:23S rRNA (uracil1939-C5)-methyltransferase